MAKKTAYRAMEEGGLWQGGLGLDPFRLKTAVLLVKPLFSVFGGRVLSGLQPFSQDFFVVRQLRVPFPVVWSNAKPNSDTSRPCSLLRLRIYSTAL